MRDDSLIDPLDREIAQVLAIDPSADLIARVRRRIAMEPVRGAWRFRWIAAAATVALAVAVTIAMVLIPHEIPAPAVLVTRASAGIATLPSLAGPEHLPGSARRDAYGTDPTRQSHSTHPTRATYPAHPTYPTHVAEPEILVDAREANAMHQVLDRLNSGRMYLTPFVVAEAPIYIAPVDIKGVQP